MAPAMSTGTVTLAGYLVLVAAFLAVELAARRTARVRPMRPTLEAILSHRPVLVVVIAGWLWLGWHLFVRVHR
jgi:uncharacterized protein YqcC (DUF446 family)